MTVLQFKNMLLVEKTTITVMKQKAFNYWAFLSASFSLLTIRCALFLGISPLAAAFEIWLCTTLKLDLSVLAVNSVLNFLISFRNADF